MPIAVPKGIFRRDKHDSTIPKILLQDFFVSSP